MLNRHRRQIRIDEMKDNDDVYGEDQEAVGDGLSDNEPTSFPSRRPEEAMRTRRDADRSMPRYLTSPHRND